MDLFPVAPIATWPAGMTISVVRVIRSALCLILGFHGRRFDQIQDGGHEMIWYDITADIAEKCRLLLLVTSLWSRRSLPSVPLYGYFWSCMYLVYFPMPFCLSVSVKWLAVKTTSEMTQILSRRTIKHYSILRFEYSSVQIVFNW